MASAWNQLPLVLPVDGSEVWIRRLFWSAPFVATWSMAGQIFTHSSGMEIPWYMVAKWRAL